MADQIFSPLKGKAIQMTEVSDPMFSQKLLGDGVAVYPEFKTGWLAKNGTLHAPCDGEVILVFTEKHALGFRTKEGNEILIHIGIDTVELKGEPFIISCKEGDIVKQGQKIGEINWKMIAKAGKDTVVPVIWTNSDGNKELKVVNDSDQVDEQSVLFTI